MPVSAQSHYRTGKIDVLGGPNLNARFQLIFFYISWKLVRLHRIFERHIFNYFVATVIQETNILVIFNVFMKYSEIYNNSGRPYFDFW